MATTYRDGVGLQCRGIGRPHVAVLMFEPFPGDGYPAQREEPRSITTRPDVCSHPETPLPGDETAGLPPLRARCQGQEPTEGGARCGQDGAAGLPGRPGAGFGMVRGAAVLSERGVVSAALLQWLQLVLDHLRVAALPDSPLS